MAAPLELAAERDRRKGVARIAERRYQDPHAVDGTQSRSASACSIFERPSMSGAIGVVIRVPTPASR